jgi:hypothetical protein
MSLYNRGEEGGGRYELGEGCIRARGQYQVSLCGPPSGRDVNIGMGS